MPPAIACDMIDWHQIDQALAEGPRLGISSSEVIRRLAISEESQGASWERVGALYYIGLALGDCEIEFFRSMAISALECLHANFGLDNTIQSVASADANWALKQLLFKESPVTGESLYLKACSIYWPIICNISHKYSSNDGTLHDAVVAYRQALEVDPSHWLARYYLICCLFDLQDWSAAMNETNNLIETKTHPIHQHWRRTKLLEWRIVCLLHLDKVEQAESLLDEFLNQFALDKPADLESKIESLDELAQCIQDYEIDSSLKDRFYRLKYTLETAGVI